MNSHALGQLHTLQTGVVTDNVDLEQRGRIKVRLHATPMEIWASVVAPSAGHGFGVSFIPRLDEIVVLAFITPELPLVLGSIWTGQNSVPTECDPQEDHYVIRTPNGTVLEFDDGDGPKLEMRTPSGYRITLTEGQGGAVEVERGGQSVRLTASEISIRSSGPVNIDAASVNVTAASVRVDAGMSRFSGVVQADTVIANAVVGTSYTPGAGNVW
jgi:uncharacterized protein involved in type VI secretion and phage assembly